MKATCDGENAFLLLPEENTLTKDELEKENDPLTEIIGEMGPFQITLGILLSITIMTHAQMQMSNKWVTQSVEYGCARPKYLGGN